MISLPIVQAAAARALASGAQRPIATESIVLEDEAVAFVVRVVSSLERKRAARAAPRAARDPLGDYEPDLFVAGAGPAHYLLLNKYNVLPLHLLLVTRRFERQEEALTARDFAALARCMASLDWLAFYNAGAEAGASQPRKHLQLAPLAPIPIEAFLDAGGKLPFRHAFARVTSPQELHALYREQLAICGIGPDRPYNLLLTRRWMLLVPRLREHFESISVNALGFAGSFFVRTRGELERVRSVGPMKILRSVAIPPP